MKAFYKYISTTALIGSHIDSAFVCKTDREKSINGDIYNEVPLNLTLDSQMGHKVLRVSAKHKIKILTLMFYSFPLG